MKKVRWKMFTGFFMILSVIALGSIVFFVFSYTQEHAGREAEGVEPNGEVYQEVQEEETIPQVPEEDESEETPEEEPEEEEPEEQEEEEVPLMVYDGIFELPIAGATGFAPVFMSVRASPDVHAASVLDLSPGSGFTILEEQEEWWQIEVEGLAGWVLHAYCFINLPDVMPSIVYNVTNASSSVIRSSGVEVPRVTGHRLYQGCSYNPRLGREEYISAILYSTAIRVADAQRMALSEGNTLVLVEAFRPLSTQMLIVEALSALAMENAVVHQGLNQGAWHMGWFVATGVSSHQTGAAIDVTLAQVNATETRGVGSYSITVITDYTEFIMPSPIHELSVQAVVLASPMSTMDLTAWANATLAPTMNEAAMTLQRYLLGAGFTPLASEWWHFDDSHSAHRIRYNSGNGDFVLSEVFSRVPEGIE